MAPNRKTIVLRMLPWPMQALWASVVLAVSLTTHSQAQSTVARPEEKTPSELRKALDQLTSSNPEDWQKSVVVLNKLRNEQDMRPMAICGLALFYTKENKVQAIENLCSKVNITFPAAGPDLSAYLLRIQFWLDLVQEDRLDATEHFSELAALALRKELSQASRDAISALLGNVMGLLESKTANSPIEPEVLAAVQKKLLDRENSEFATNLQPRYKIARLYADSAEKWFEQHATAPPNALIAIAQQELQESQSQLSKTLADHSDRCREKEILEDERRTTFKLLEPLKTPIAEVESLWHQNPQIHNPIAPNRNAISVPTTEEKYTGKTEEVKKTRSVTRNGKEVEETYYKTEKIYETVRRSQRDIEAHIDAIYLPRLMHYRSLVSNRENLLAQRRALEQKANAIRAEIARIVALIDAKDAEIRTGKQDRKMLQSEKKVLEACNKSLEVGAPKFAFRPQVYEIFDFIAEKNVILESHRVRK